MEMTKFNEKYENYLKKIEKEMEEKYNFRTNANYYFSFVLLSVYIVSY